MIPTKVGCDAQEVKMSHRETEIVGRDLVVINIVLQFAHRFSLPYKKGFNIQTAMRSTQTALASVVILDLGKFHDFQFCIEKSTEGWQMSYHYPIKLNFAEGKSKIEKHYRHRFGSHSQFVATENPDTGKITFTKW